MIIHNINENVCPDGECPAGIVELKKIGLAPEERRAIFDSLMRNIAIEDSLSRTFSEKRFEIV